MPPNVSDNKPTPTAQHKLYPFQRAVFRGLAVILPPLLTIVILIWVGNAVQQYVLVPVESGAKYVIVWTIADIQNTDPGKGYEKIGQHWVPQEISYHVDRFRGNLPKPETAQATYSLYVKLRYLKSQYVIPLFLSLFIIILYLLGKFLAIRVGRIFWDFFEQIIHRLPVISNVYSSVKQVTDFVFSEQEIEYRRVVAVEYPRQGIWSIGFVTGDSLLDVDSAANESVMSVFIPSSPMPVTGYTITIRRNEAVDLDLTVDQAIQFVVSCGVVVPPHQLRNNKNPQLNGPQTARPNGFNQSSTHGKFLQDPTTTDESNR